MKESLKTLFELLFYAPVADSTSKLPMAASSPGLDTKLIRQLERCSNSFFGLTKNVFFFVSESTRDTFFSFSLIILVRASSSSAELCVPWRRGTQKIPTTFYKYENRQRASKFSALELKLQMTSKTFLFTNISSIVFLGAVDTSCVSSSHNNILFNFRLSFSIYFDGLCVS